MRIGDLGISMVDIRIPIRTAHLHHSISRVACERIGGARVLECDGKGIVFLERRNRVVTTTTGAPRNGRRWPQLRRLYWMTAEEAERL